MAQKNAYQTERTREVTPDDEQSLVPVYLPDETVRQSYEATFVSLSDELTCQGRCVLVSSVAND